jgi:tetratricopeptide (TPR) repeat protein
MQDENKDFTTVPLQDEHDSLEAADARDIEAAEYEKEEKYAMAFSGYLQGLRIRRKLLCTEEHRDVAKSYDNLGRVLEGQAKVEESLKMYRKGLSVLKDVHGIKHPNVAIAYRNIARVLITLGDEEEAKKCAKMCTVIEKMHESCRTFSIRSMETDQVLTKHADMTDGWSRVSLGFGPGSSDRSSVDRPNYKEMFPESQGWSKVSLFGEKTKDGKRVDKDGSDSEDTVTESFHLSMIGMTILEDNEQEAKEEAPVVAPSPVKVNKGPRISLF